ncbi:toxin-activating lysine-acyltransferase [Pseudomonas simiae]|uniref:toxin-activating lysine-acyltransferase n=1 Tax=Pseudomonas simiae TaxID=321846 RepID=UPI000D047D88|nr:toxin-activating lysine-acyltransferase [Pseudomonas simiae]PRW84531.1 toxin-activating lysine-acyltransferase [Pseudomonas simiae]
MNKRYELFTICRTASHMEKANSLGFALWVAMQSHSYYMFRLIDLRVWIEPAIHHNQIMFFFDIFDKPIGYIIWANLAPDVEKRFLNNPDFLLHESEWDEGNKTWILDCCFPFGGVRHAICKLRKKLLLQNIRRVSWVRRNPDYSIKKVFVYEGREI